MTTPSVAHPVIKLAATQPINSLSAMRLILFEMESGGVSND